MSAEQIARLQQEARHRWHGECNDEDGVSMGRYTELFRWDQKQCAALYAAARALYVIEVAS